MRFRASLAALLLVAIVTACQSTPGGGAGSTAPNAAPPSDMPEAPATPYAAPGY